MAIVWVVWRLFVYVEVVIYYTAKQRRAAVSEQFDDILLPIVDVGESCPCAGNIFTLQPSALTGWIALARFSLANGTRHPLNMFASLAMLVDTPFKCGDFIENWMAIFFALSASECMTELYDTHTHTIIFMPRFPI